MKSVLRFSAVCLAVLLSFTVLVSCKDEIVEEEGWGALAEEWPIFADSMSEITKNAAFLDKTQYRYEKATADKLERLAIELGILLNLEFEGKIKAGVVVQNINTQKQCTVLEFESSDYAQRFAKAYNDYLGRVVSGGYTVRSVGSIAAYSVSH